MMSERRLDIEEWWAGNLDTSFPFPGSVLENRLYEAFRTILEKLPQQHFDSFKEIDPVIFCQPEARARVLAISPPAPILTVVYFSPECSEVEENEFLNIVAHEIAHVVLGHQDVVSHVDLKRSEGEEAADRLAKSWGFGGGYSDEMLGEIRQQERPEQK